jgi:hypothetical protein
MQGLGDRKMTTKRLHKGNDKELWGTSVYPPDEGGYCVEIFDPNGRGEQQTTLHGLESAAWKEAEDIAKKDLQ